MSGHVATPVQVEFTSNGRFLLSSGWDSRAMLWDSASGNQLLSIERCGQGLQIADDDSRFAVVGQMNHQMWRFTTEHEFRSLAGEIEDVAVTSMDINPDRTLLAAATKAGVRIWNLQTGKTYCFVSLAGPRTVLFSPDGSHLLTSFAGGIRQFNVADLAGKDDQPADPVSEGFTSAMAASADFRTMVFGTPDGSVRVANPETLDRSVPLGRHIRPPRYAAVSATGDWAATSSRWEKPKVWNLKTRTLATELPISPNMIEAGEVAFDPSGKVLITSDCLAYRWYSVGDWKPIRQLNLAQRNSGLEAFSPDGKLCAVRGAGFGCQLLDAQTGAEIATIDMPICAIRFSRDSKLLALGGAFHEILLWDLQSVRRNLASMNLDWKW